MLLNFLSLLNMNFHDDRTNTFFFIKKTSKFLFHFEDIVVVSDLSTLLKYSSENEKDERREEKKQLFQKLFIYQKIITITRKNIQTLQSRKLYKKPSSKI